MVNLWRYGSITLLAAAMIGIILYVADRFGGHWGGLVASIPVGFILVTSFLKVEQIEEFSFFAGLGAIAYMFYVFCFFILYSYWDFRKFQDWF